MSEHTSSHGASSTLPTESLVGGEEKDPNVVTSVSDFIKKIVQRDKEAGTETFYRGHADASWSLTPSIFRTRRALENEHLLFRDMVVHTPRSFSECKSALDYLVQMQHYGLPTRLLDVSTNPLVALYFSCQGAGDASVSNLVNVAFDAGRSAGWDVAYDPETGDSDGEWPGAIAGVFAGTLAATRPGPLASSMVDSLIDAIEKQRPGSQEAARAGAKAGEEAVLRASARDGEVYLFSVPESKVKHYDSHTASVLANLAKCKFEEINISLYAPEDSKSYFCKGLSLDIQQDESWRQAQEYEEMYFEKKLDPPFSPATEPWLSEIWRDIILKTPAHRVGSLYLEYFNQQEGIQPLLSQIREEKPLFQPLIQPCEMVNVFLVKAKKDNPRIINQSGAFFLFGLGLSSEVGPAGGQERLCCRKLKPAVIPEDWIKRRFRVPAENKETILKELASLGITESYIYPEMGRYANELKEKYGSDKESLQ